MRFAILAVFMVIMAGFFHMIFIVVDYGFNNPDTGAFTRVQHALNETLSPRYTNWVNNNTMIMRQFFGIGRVILIALCPILLAVEILDRKSTKEG